VVVPLTGLSMNHLYTPAFDLFKKILGFDQSNYPDSLKVYVDPCDLYRQA
jgi:hypothetical protein